jgi:NADH-quinone oxidoreductase subunit M
MSLLILLFLTPFLASLILFCLPSCSSIGLKRLALGFSCISWLILIYGYNSWIGSAVNIPWLPPLSIEFYLRLDAVSLLFLVLTALIIPISILAVQEKNLILPHVFYGLVLILEGLLFGFFMARDLVFFAVFYEAMLLPLYFIISIWGGNQRRYAAIQFLVYMIAGSALMVAAVLALYQSSGSFNLDIIAKSSSPGPHAAWIFAFFLLAFAVKTPLFPFHIWLPDAYCQASTSGTILLSGLLSKAGIYGIFRIIIELFPTLLKEWSPWLLGLAIAGVLYGAFAAWSQNDFKRLIAYSSFSHVNFILVGLFVWNEPAPAGAILQAINHGITITALFLAAGWLEERVSTTDMRSVKGLAKYLPQLCWFTLVFVLSSVALPGTNNFVGEIMILFGLFGVHPWLTAILGLSVIFSVVYMLRWMQSVYFETPLLRQPGWVDIKGKEISIALVLSALIFWLGIYPQPVLNEIIPAAAKEVAIIQSEDAQ